MPTMSAGHCDTRQTDLDNPAVTHCTLAIRSSQRKLDISFLPNSVRSKNGRGGSGIGARGIERTARMTEGIWLSADFENVGSLISMSVMTLGLYLLGICGGLGGGRSLLYTTGGSHLKHRLGDNTLAGASASCAVGGFEICPFQCQLYNKALEVSRMKYLATSTSADQ